MKNEPKSNPTRRDALKLSGVAAGGALLSACATSGASKDASVKTPFNVPQTFVPIVGTDEMYPVRRIYCIGRNYAAHAREMG